MTDLKARSTQLEKSEVVWEEKQEAGGGTCVAHTLVMDRGVPFAEALKVSRYSLGRQSMAEMTDADMDVLTHRGLVWCIFSCAGFQVLQEVGPCAS